MNISFVNDSLGYGGAAKMMVVVAKGLIKKGHNVSIINLNSGHTPVFQNVDGIRVVTSNIEQRKGFIANIKCALFTIKAAKTLCSDILIGFKTVPNFCVSIAGRVLNIPSVISERGDPYVNFSNIKFPTKVKLFVINHATAAVFQTVGARMFYSKHLQKHSAIIPNPILFDSSAFYVDYEKRPKTIVSLGRFDNKQKRLDIMINAFSIFHSTHPDYSLIIYGSGADECLLYDLIKKFNIVNSVKIMGISRNSLRDLSKEGMFLITSDFEGISNSLLEAMAVGLPVISTDHTPGGARLLIQDHENGLLVPIRDIDAIALALAEFADNPELANKCGRNAQKVVARFSVDQSINSWNDFILSLINN